MKMKPRILYIATFPPPVHGSAVVSQQIRDSKLISDVFDGDFVNLATSRGLDERNNYVLKLFRFMVSFSKTFILLLTRHYDLSYCAITCYGGCFIRDSLYVLLCKLFGQKIVIHQHNKGMSNYVDRPLYRTLYPMVYKNVKVILLSWHLYPDIEKLVSKDDVLICPNGVKSMVKGCPEHTSVGKPNILFLSNLLITKGVLVLLDALEILKEKGVDYSCDIVGSETREISSNRLRTELLNRGLTSDVHFHGRKVGKEKDGFFLNADVFTLPSTNEAFGIVNVEAMEYGLPVVSTKEGGIFDTVVDGETGYLVDKFDSAALAEALEKLLTDPHLRSKMGKAGRKRFEELFEETVFENTMLECLKKSML